MKNESGINASSTNPLLASSIGLRAIRLFDVVVSRLAEDAWISVTDGLMINPFASWIDPSSILLRDVVQETF